MNNLKTLGWGLYLTCSWTWCIGMFLPVVLLHRYGWAGYAVFAIPNLIGCVAFGYVVRTPERSKALVEKYRSLMSLFSVVTIAFHAFFIAMLAQLHLNATLAGASVWIPLAILTVAACLVMLPSRWWPLLAVIVWMLSLTAGLSLLPFEAEVQGSRPWQDALWLLPITLFGFLLCPYLDLTFHKAIQSAPSKHAFAVFGVTFAAMIAVTSLYQDIILSWLPVLLAAHLGLQATFTISAHGKEICRLFAGQQRKLCVAIIGLSCAFAIVIAHWPHDLVQGQINNYLRFFVFYGLLFPGLVLTFIVTGRQFTRHRLALFSCLMLFSMPLLEFGYIGQSAWLTIFPVILSLALAYHSMKFRIGDSVGKGAGG